ncbi:MAG: phosphoglucosamine mutase [Haloarculaceae archaeon]
MELFGSSGIRGVVNADFGPDDALAVAQAAGTELDADRVAVARDTRVTGEMLADAVTSGFASVGVSADRLGVLPTPGLQAYCEAESVPGLTVTASHNPPQYNGVKLVAADGVEFPRERLEAVETRLLEDGAERVAWDGTGTTRTVGDAGERYVADLLAAVDRRAVADADLTVAIDPGHGAGALTSPDFFRRLGCGVRTVNAQPDGHFPGRNPEPVEETLGDLQRFVRATGADLGVAHDGDADRAIFVDERGELLAGDATFAALVADALEAGDTVVSAVNASQRVVDAVEAAGADLSLTPIGSTYIVTRIRGLQADGETVPVAGEGNGGVIFPGYRVARDGAYTAGRFLEILADRDAPASEVVAAHDGYANLRRNLSYDDEDERAAMLAAIEEHAREADADPTTTDGYRLDYGDAWVLARPSGTEPVVRVYAEARSAERARQLADEVAAAARSAIE